MFDKIVLPDFYYNMEILKPFYLEKSIEPIVTWFNSLTRDERGLILYQRMTTIFKYTVMKSKNFLRKYIDEIKRRDG